MALLQFTLFTFSLSLLAAAWLAPRDAWLTPLHEYTASRSASDNDDASSGECEN
jgi:hypothetical protein